jgi:hypothetical protein
MGHHIISLFFQQMADIFPFTLHWAHWKCRRIKYILFNEYSFELDKSFLDRGFILTFDEIWLSKSPETGKIFTSLCTLFYSKFSPLIFELNP